MADQDDIKEQSSVRLLRLIDEAIMFCANYNNYHKDESHCMDMDNAMNYLLTKGYSMINSMHAFTKAHYDIDVAETYLKNGFMAKIQSRLQTEQLFTPSTTSIESLTKMGFTRDESIFALQRSGGNDKIAIDLLNGDCYGSIKQCRHLERLTNVFNHHLQLTDKKKHNFTIILNDFNHLIFNHDSDLDFEYISNKFVKCDVEQCKMMQEHRRNREEMLLTDVNADNKNNNQTVILQLYNDIINKIHCHFVHSYDIGLRLSAQQIEHLKQIDDDKADDNQNIASTTNTQLKLSTINKFLKPKQKLHFKIGNIKPLNKFTDLRATNNSEYKSFDNGLLFYYWEFYKNCDEPDATNGSMYKYKDWYIEPTYSSLKQELINNKVIRLTNSDWNNEYQKIMEHLKTDYCKTLIADPQEDFTHQANTKHYGILKGSPITFKHLIAVSVYCGYTNLSYKFRETFRKLSVNETDESIKKRNSNFHYLSKYICESINIFSKTTIDMDMKTFYHGISEQMVFKSISMYMHQPWSTTSSSTVAVHFSGCVGMILEIHSTPTIRYFDCAGISNFSNERELLFISSFFPMKIMNITDLSEGKEFKEFLKSIAVIDALVKGYLWYSDNHSVWRNIVKEEKKQNITGDDELSDYNPLLFGGKLLDPVVKLLTIKLIKYKVYKKTKIKIPNYIDKLFTNICSKKRIVRCNFEFLNVEMSKQYNGSNGGYLGYMFLKYLICKKQIEMLKLDFICKLFPNVEIIIVMGIEIVSSLTLDYILNYLSNYKKSSIQRIALYFDQEMMKNIFLLYKEQFTKIGWIMTLTKKFVYRKNKKQPSVNICRSK